MTVTSAVVAPSAPTTRERLVAAARRITIEEGWAAVTMQRLADDVGVSRQTVYNDVGGKQPLAETLVLDELDRFLAIVDDAFAAHPDDVVAAIRTAVEAVLAHARDNTLLHAIVSASHGADTELLPLLTTNSAALLSAATEVVLQRVRRYPIDLDDDRLHAGVELIVRAVLSHIMRPSATPSVTADHLAWISRRVLSAD